MQVPRRLVDEMVAQAQVELPNECCGFLIGRVEQPVSADFGDATAVAQVVERYPLVNAAASPVAYFADPDSLFAAHKTMRRLSLELIAIYHSHPTSAPVPSRKDREQNQHPGVIHLIISLQTNPPILRAWWLTADAPQEAAWDIVNDG
jgi:proteasome lid subunit RPN8/RPN11